MTYISTIDVFTKIIAKYSFHFINITFYEVLDIDMVMFFVFMIQYVALLTY